MFKAVTSEMKSVEFGVHLHTVKDKALEKIESAFDAGCQRYDGAIMGFGGCPMAKDELTGNMPSEVMVDYFQKKEMLTNFSKNKFSESMIIAGNLFDKYH